HPPKKLREYYGALGGASAAGKSRSSVQSLFNRTVLNAEARGEPIPTLPFVTSSVSATPEREDKSHADSVTGLNLRTIGAPKSDFLIGGIRTVVKPDSDLQKVYVSEWSVTNGFGLDDSRIYREMLNEFAPPKFFASVRGMDHDQLFTEFNVGAARQIYLSAEVKDGEIKNIKAQLLLKEAEAAEAIRLRAEVFKFEPTEKSLQGEVGALREYSATLEREKNELSVKVTDLLASVKV
nr:hypothetical protein [Tanacetum cinerariifolium]